MKKIFLFFAVLVLVASLFSCSSLDKGMQKNSAVFSKGKDVYVRLDSLKKYGYENSLPVFGDKYIENWDKNGNKDQKYKLAKDKNYLIVKNMANQPFVIYQSEEIKEYNWGLEITAKPSIGKHFKKEEAFFGGENIEVKSARVEDPNIKYGDKPELFHVSWMGLNKQVDYVLQISESGNKKIEVEPGENYAILNWKDGIYFQLVSGKSILDVDNENEITLIGLKINEYNNVGVFELIYTTSVQEENDRSLGLLFSGMEELKEKVDGHDQQIKKLGDTKMDKKKKTTKKKSGTKKSGKSKSKSNLKEYVPLDRLNEIISKKEKTSNDQNVKNAVKDVGEKAKKESVKK